MSAIPINKIVGCCNIALAEICVLPVNVTRLD
jgi:hypothetical protein